MGSYTALSPPPPQKKKKKSFLFFYFVCVPGSRELKYLITILQLNTNVLKLIILQSNLDNHEFKNSTINLRFNAFLKIEIVLLSCKERSSGPQVLLDPISFPVCERHCDTVYHQEEQEG